MKAMNHLAREESQRRFNYALLSNDDVPFVDP
jgi:hypothetical protein